MPSAVVVSQFERRLREMGFSTRQVRREVLELADHYEDLKSDALEEGLTEAAAEARAEQRLGEPLVLAELMAAALRQSTWRGRHPFIAFCLLPPFVILLLLSLGVGLDALVGRIYFTPEQISALADNSFGLTLCIFSAKVTYYLAVSLSVLLFGWAAQSTGSWLKWSLASCAAATVHCLFFYLSVVPHEVSVGYGTQSQWMCALIPVSVTALMCAVHWRTMSVLEPLPFDATNWRLKKAAARLVAREAPLPRTDWLTPSSVIAALATSAIILFIICLCRDFSHHVARTQELRSHIWPAERAQVRKQLLERQAIRETRNETKIDLSPYLNAALTGSFNPDSAENDNTLAMLPQGTHIYGGVPFNIEGRVQLFGRRFCNTHRLLPVKVKNIVINQKCEKIHLLHGAAYVDAKNTGNAIALLILHYADGSRAEINICSGSNVRDWRGPLYHSDTNDGPDDGLASGSELAWAETNSHLAKQQPESSLRLYKSTFTNPYPERKILSLDYASTLTDAAPFMVGLTIE